jgi:hypothetical protein
LQAVKRHFRVLGAKASPRLGLRLSPRRYHQHLPAGRGEERRRPTWRKQLDRGWTAPWSTRRARPPESDSPSSRARHQGTKKTGASDVPHTHWPLLDGQGQVSRPADRASEAPRASSRLLGLCKPKPGECIMHSLCQHPKDRRLSRAGKIHNSFSNNSL